MWANQLVSSGWIAASIGSNARRHADSRLSASATWSVTRPAQRDDRRGQAVRACP